jgi:hypothetical protein
MPGWFVEFYLAKSRQSIADVLAKQQTVNLNALLECYLGPRTEANRDVQVIWARKATSRRRLEFGRNQRVRNLGRTRCDRVQAVIAHGALLKMNPSHF